MKVEWLFPQKHSKLLTVSLLVDCFSFGDDNDDTAAAAAADPSLKEGASRLIDFCRRCCCCCCCCCSKADEGDADDNDGAW